MAGTWECIRCGEENILSRTCCFMCYTDKPPISPTKNKAVKRKKLTKSKSTTPPVKTPLGSGPKTPPGPCPVDQITDVSGSHFERRPVLPLFPGPRTPPGPAPDSSPDTDPVAGLLQRSCVPETPPSSESPIRGNLVASRANTIQCPFCKRVIDKENCPTCQTLVCWRCRFCKTLFTLDNERCKVCKADRNDATSRDTSLDWTCRYCKVANYHKRSLCFSCKAYKETEDSKSLSALYTDYPVNSDSFDYDYNFDSSSLPFSPRSKVGPSSVDLQAKQDRGESTELPPSSIHYPVKKDRGESTEGRSSRGSSKNSSSGSSIRQSNGRESEQRDTPKPGDWYCRYCKGLNFRKREVCFTCRAFKEVSVTEVQAKNPLKHQLPPKSIEPAAPPKSLSTWMCSECKFRNLMFRMHCYQCGNGRHPFQRNISNDWSCETCCTVNSTEMFDRGCYVCFPLKNQEDPELRPAICRLDSKVNIKTITDAKEMITNKKKSKKDACETEKSEVSLGEKSIVAPYDWVCPLCSFSNIALRNFCKGCDAPRSSIISILLQYRKRGVACFTDKQLIRQMTTPIINEYIEEGKLSSLKCKKRDGDTNDEAAPDRKDRSNPTVSNSHSWSSVQRKSDEQIPKNSTVIEEKLEPKVYEEGEIKDDDDSSNGSRTNNKAITKTVGHESIDKNPPKIYRPAEAYKQKLPSKNHTSYDRDYKQGLLASPGFSDNHEYRHVPAYRLPASHRPQQAHRPVYTPHSFPPVVRRPHQQPLLRAPFPKYPRPRFRNY